VNLPIRVRLTLWYTAILAGALLLFSITVYVVTNRALTRNLDSSLTQRAAHIESMIEVEHGTITLPRGEEQADEPLIPTVLFSPSGRPLLGTVPAAARGWLAAHPLTGIHGRVFATTGGIRVLVRPAFHDGRFVGYVLAWQSLSTIDSARDTLLLVVVSAAPLLLLVAILGGLGLARRALEPVAEITRVASGISVTDLHRRVPTGTTRDELGTLASTFNTMIARLEGAVQREKSFTADASHELRSPLAVIRAEATLALDRPRAVDEYQRALAAIDDQAAAMEDLLAALLVLARAGSMPLAQEPATLADLAADAIAEARQAVNLPNARVDCAVPAHLCVAGSEALLTRAIRNLVENALKVSGPEDPVCVRGWRENQTTVLTVSDRGPGIAPEHQERIFEPFYQVAGARTPGQSHGLGLAICRRIIEAHSGTITVDSSPGRGATFRLDLPALPDQSIVDITPDIR
jgi:signal transduction histidine kinase